jgi:hypothetical protein
MPRFTNGDKFEILTLNELIAMWKNVDFVDKIVVTVILLGSQKNKIVKVGEHMKHGERPTRAQKILINSAGLNSANWLVTKNTDKLEIVHRNTGTIKVISK